MRTFAISWFVASTSARTRGRTPVQIEWIRVCRRVRIWLHLRERFDGRVDARSDVVADGRDGRSVPPRRRLGLPEILVTEPAAMLHHVEGEVCDDPRDPRSASCALRVMLQAIETTRRR
ncbi:MAG: hypothetical protein ACXW5U_23820 [Thermoanaerobaculia bacterium]